MKFLRERLAREYHSRILELAMKEDLEKRTQNNAEWPYKTRYFVVLPGARISMESDPLILEGLTVYGLGEITGFLPNP